MTDLRAITLHQPWASLVAFGAKTIETRSWRTDYRGPLLIHAGKARPDFSPLPIREACYSYAIGVWEQRPNEPGGVLVCVDQSTIDVGAVVASATLLDCVPMGWGVHATPPFLTIDVHSPTTLDLTAELPFGDYRQGRYAWLLDAVKPTTERCPRCWGEARTVEPSRSGSGLFDGPCPTCRATPGCCAPVPMRGRQGLWIPKPEDWA